MHLLQVATSKDPEHVTACPFVLPDTPATAPAEPRRNRRPGNRRPEDRRRADVTEQGDHADLRRRGARVAGHGGDRGQQGLQDRPRPIVHAVRDVSFNLYRGAVVALVGESGSGKSTAARLLAGQERLTSGTIKLDGKPVEVRRHDDFRRYKSQVQYVSRTRSPRSTRCTRCAITWSGR